MIPKAKVCLVRPGNGYSRGYVRNSIVKTFADQGLSVLQLLLNGRDDPVHVENSLVSTQYIQFGVGRNLISYVMDHEAYPPTDLTIISAMEDFTHLGVRAGGAQRFEDIVTTAQTFQERRGGFVVLLTSHLPYWMRMGRDLPVVLPYHAVPGTLMYVADKQYGQQT